MSFEGDIIMEFYIYEWYRIDTGEIFYVGKGKGTRYTQKKNRSKMFRDYINKYNCYRRISGKSHWWFSRKFR